MTYESHILLVEDCPSYARLITAVLAQIREPNHLTRATSGERAIELLSDRERFSRRNPDLILLDVNLPGQDGFEVLSCIKSSAIYRTIPVVMLSATADELVVRRAYDLHANAFVHKSDSQEETTDALDTLCHLWLSVAARPAIRRP
jgi:CheY-like chemotaxis protein